MIGHRGYDVWQRTHGKGADHKMCLSETKSHHQTYCSTVILLGEYLSVVKTLEHFNIQDFLVASRSKPNRTTLSHPIPPTMRHTQNRKELPVIRLRPCMHRLSLHKSRTSPMASSNLSPRLHPSINVMVQSSQGIQTDDLGFPNRKPTKALFSRIHSVR